ncbi:heat shock protein HspQ [Bradyrhizobium sp. BR13661]|jgi:heat shock protein HspQ|uniref:heat shock protein HspQ n=2 Tax=Pseudomonadota TaxID=1224 RepID=UPI0024768B63|nr:heat shock protein HspQ [Bradyrhizobium sp. BR13661]MDH6263274.1 heat shock protein HspQ [Bradyrhizobium sp. BR13661]
MSKTQFAKYNIGQVIRHRLYEMRGVIFDVETSFAGMDGEPPTNGFATGLVYRLFAEDDEIPYVASIAEHDLEPDDSGLPVRHPGIGALFEADDEGSYRRRRQLIN